MSTKEELAQAIIDAAELVAVQGGCPESIYHPDLGWVLWEGKATQTSEAFLKLLEEARNKK